MGFSEEGRFNQFTLQTVYREDFIAERRKESRGEGWLILNKCSHPLIDLLMWLAFYWPGHFRANTISLVWIHSIVKTNRYYKVTINTHIHIQCTYSKLCEFKMASGMAFLWWPEVSSMQFTHCNSCVIIRLLVPESPQSMAHLFTCCRRSYSLPVQSTISWVTLWQIDHLLKLCPEKQFSNYSLT